MLEIKKKVDWAFFFLFLGGILLIVNTILGSIIFAVRDQQMVFMDGFGLFSLYTEYPKQYAGTGVNLFIGLLALIVGLRLFLKPFYAFISKIDVAIIGLVMIFLGIGCFTFVGLFLVIGGIYCFLYRITLDGAKNPKAV